MEIKSVIREIKLSKLLNEPLSGDTLIINNFFDELFNGLEIDALDEYPDSIFFIKNGEDVYMEQDYKNESLYCSHDKIWSFFEENLSLDYREISDLIKVMVEQYLKEKVFTPTYSSSVIEISVEQHLKEKVFTPNLPDADFDSLVEQQLKEKVFTPWPMEDKVTTWVEQQLKEKVFTPIKDNGIGIPEVEQQLKELKNI